MMVTLRFGGVSHSPELRIAAEGDHNELKEKVMRHRLLIAVLAPLAFALMAASAAAHSFGVVGHVYVDENTAGTNTIAAFDRHADGTLAPEAGSPFDTGGAGTGAPIGSQGALQSADGGRYLLAVDPGSNTISVLRVHHDGSLRLVGVTGSGGDQPVSLAVDDNLVYVANAGSPDSNYTGFTLNRGGRLEPIPGSTVELPSGSDPGDVLFNSDGRNLVGTRVGTSLIDSFRVRDDGTLKAAPGSPFTAQGTGPFGSEFRPTDPNQLFVSNAHNGGTDGTVSAFSVGYDGALASIGESPFPDNQTAPCWVEISHDGNFLFTVNTGSGTISSYYIKDDGTLTLLGSTGFTGGKGGGAQDARLSPDGRTLWVVDTKAQAISGFSVDGGSLTELPSSPTALPADSAAFGIVVT